MSVNGNRLSNIIVKQIYVIVYSWTILPFLSCAKPTPQQFKSKKILQPYLHVLQSLALNLLWNTSKYCPFSLSKMVKSSKCFWHSKKAESRPKNRDITFLQRNTMTYSILWLKDFIAFKPLGHVFYSLFNSNSPFILP